MRSFCSALNIAMSLRKATLYEVDERLKVAGQGRKNEAAGKAAGRDSPRFLN
jgi:hypothetical protein